MNDYKIILYEAINLINGKRYIGITKFGLKARRNQHIWTAHSGRGSAFGAAIRKYGQDNFKFRALVVCSDFDYAKLIEIATIWRFKPEYNMTAGGDGCVGFKHSEEHKARMTLLQKGKQYALGRTLTEEHKQCIRQARLSGKGGPKKGQKYNLSPEERARRGARIKAYHSIWVSGVQDNSLTEG